MCSFLPHPCVHTYLNCVNELDTEIELDTEMGSEKETKGLLRLPPSPSFLHCVM